VVLAQGPLVPVPTAEEPAGAAADAADRRHRPTGLHARGRRPVPHRGVEVRAPAPPQRLLPESINVRPRARTTRTAILRVRPGAPTWRLESASARGTWRARARGRWPRSRIAPRVFGVQSRATRARARPSPPRGGTASPRRAIPKGFRTRGSIFGAGRQTLRELPALTKLAEIGVESRILNPAACRGALRTCGRSGQSQLVLAGWICPQWGGGRAVSRRVSSCFLLHNAAAGLRHRQLTGPIRNPTLD
jgi:hypothetical protein